MRRPRVNLTIRGLMIAVALVALNLAGAIATSKFYPRPMPPLPVSIGNGRLLMTTRTDGSVWYSVGNLETGYRLRHVELRPRRPTLLQIWSPVIAGAAITLLVLALKAGSTPSTARHRIPRRGLTGRGVTIAVALVVLNLACAVYAPPPEPDHRPWCYVYRGEEETVVSRSDGSVIVYKGLPGRLSQPRMLWPPTRSRLRTWSPVIAGATITLLVLAAIAPWPRCARPRSFLRQVSRVGGRGEQGSHR